MKAKFVIFGLVLLLGVLSFCSRSGDTSFNVTINDYSEKAIDIDINNHKKGDVFVFKNWFMEDGYGVIMFHGYSGKLRMYECFYGTKEIFDEANLIWKNDTTLIVTLINTGLDNKIHFEFFGNGNSSGMSIEDE